MNSYKFAAPIWNSWDKSADQAIAAQVAQSKRLVIFTNGCFDILHAGHLRLLNLAGIFGFLVVGLNGDDSVRKLKGPTRPVNSFGDRALMLASIRAVQAVVGFDAPRCDRLITAIKPQIYIKGGDYSMDTLDSDERKALEQVGAEIMFFPTVEGKSTSSIMDRLVIDLKQ